MKNVNKQRELFSIVKEKYQRKNFIEKLAKVLSTSQAGVYRRISGETALSFDELISIQEEFGISYNAMMSHHPSNEVTFQFNYKEEVDFAAYMEKVTYDLEMVKSIPNHKIIYSAKDLPLWHYFECEKLRAFKIFYWIRSVRKEPGYQKMKFEYDLIPDEYHEVAVKSLRAYNETNSEEIWTPSSLDIMIGQLSFYYESGIITHEQLDELTASLEEMLLKLQNKAAEGNKSEGEIESNYKVFLSDIIGGDNVIYAQAGEKQMVYHPPVLMNYIKTEDKRFCNYIKESFDIAKGTAELISSVSERRRIMFFNDFDKKVKRMRRKFRIQELV